MRSPVQPSIHQAANQVPPQIEDLETDMSLSFHLKENDRPGIGGIGRTNQSHRWDKADAVIHPGNRSAELVSALVRGRTTHAVMAHQVLPREKDRPVQLSAPIDGRSPGTS